jgi:hypothetical protein
MQEHFEMYKAPGDKPEDIKDEKVRKLYVYWLSKQG